MSGLTWLSFLDRVPLPLGDRAGVPAPALTLSVVLVGLILTLGVQFLTARSLRDRDRLRSSRAHRRAERPGTIFMAARSNPGDLATAVAFMSDRADVGVDDIEAALDHEWWVRRLLHREIVRRGGGRRELDRLRRTRVLFAVRPSSTGVHFGWDGRVRSDEPQPFHEWLSGLRRDLDHDFVVAPVDVVVDDVFDRTADELPHLDAHPLHVPTGLDDPAVGGAVVPTGPPTAVRTTRNRVLLAAA